VEHRIRAAMVGLGHIGAEAPPTWGTLRRVIAGPYRNPSTKYLSAYWNEARWRASHGRDSAAFRHTVSALLRHPHLPYERLIAAGPPSGS
jgi:hypothetical protein